MSGCLCSMRAGEICSQCDLSLYPYEPEKVVIPIASLVYTPCTQQPEKPEDQKPRINIPPPLSLDPFENLYRHVKQLQEECIAARAHIDSFHERLDVDGLWPDEEKQKAYETSRKKTDDLGFNPFERTNKSDDTWDYEAESGEG